MGIVTTNRPLETLVIYVEESTSEREYMNNRGDWEKLLTLVYRKEYPQQGEEVLHFTFVRSPRDVPSTHRLDLNTSSLLAQSGCFLSSRPSLLKSL
jgi:hypothetical protein